jgi:UDP-N-acetylmuramate: L-alanyl-gamma-D-glutamyl-meso-diaminopimelate ligase
VEAIQTQFHHLVRTIPANGLIVANGGDANLDVAIAKGCWTPIEKFGPGHQWDFKRGAEGGQFDVLLNGQKKGEVAWSQIGTHNTMNALAAIAAARHAGVPTKIALEALNQFEGVARRMEVRGVMDGVTVYDDFAHHPTAIQTTVSGLRKKVGNERIIAVLEPRSNTMKLGAMNAALPGSLSNADIVFVYANNLGWDVAKTFEASNTNAGTKTGIFNDLDAIVKTISEMAKSGDHILVMSNGGFGGVHGKILHALAMRVMQKNAKS